MELLAQRPTVVRCCHVISPRPRQRSQQSLCGDPDASRAARNLRLLDWLVDGDPQRRTGAALSAQGPRSRRALRDRSFLSAAAHEQKRRGMSADEKGVMIWTPLAAKASAFPKHENSMPPLNPDVADFAPSVPELTPYDHDHAITYMRMLDADAEGADWREVAQIVLHIDSEREPGRAKLAFESHLARAKMDDKRGIPALASTRL